MRKPISKKLRFEVFKRDGFTCQYCGARAPDVILEVDHINPVAAGGDNDIINLITACRPCNAGKGARLLDDQSVLAKQREQLAELNERREQLEMMVAWREAMENLDEESVDTIERDFERVTGSGFTEHGRSQVKAWIKRFGAQETLAASAGSLDTYYKGSSQNDAERKAQIEKSFNMIPRVAASRARMGEEPFMKDLFYIRAIIRNRMHCNDRVALDLLKKAYSAGAHIEELKDWAKTARNWTRWRTEMVEWTDALMGGKE